MRRQVVLVIITSISGVKQRSNVRSQVDHTASRHGVSREMGDHASLRYDRARE